MIDFISRRKLYSAIENLVNGVNVAKYDDVGGMLLSDAAEVYFWEPDDFDEGEIVPTPILSDEEKVVYDLIFKLVDEKDEYLEIRASLTKLAQKKEKIRNFIELGVELGCFLDEVGLGGDPKTVLSYDADYWKSALPTERAIRCLSQRISGDLSLLVHGLRNLLYVDCSTQNIRKTEEKYFVDMLFNILANYDRKVIDRPLPGEARVDDFGEGNGDGSALFNFLVLAMTAAGFEVKLETLLSHAKEFRAKYKKELP